MTTGTYDWTQLSTSLLVDCRGRFGAMNGSVHRIVGNHLAGPAVTVEVMAGENGTIHRALSEAPSGSVLVIAAGGYVDRAVWGDILAQAALQRGIAGVVVDGAVRDIDALKRVGLPTWAKGTSAAGPHKGWVGRIGRAIACAGVVVEPNDVIVADGDGVAVIPAAEEAEIHAAAVERQLMEQEWSVRISRGETTTSVLGLDRSEN